MKATKFAVCGATMALVALTACLAMSIESEPVKVTLGNSGPRYDIDEMSDEKPKLNSLVQQAPPTEPPMQQPPVKTEASQEASTDEQETPIGHVAIRRIFLFPMVRPVADSWAQPDSDLKEPQQQQPSSHEHEQVPSMFAKPFWPFMTPARPSPHNNHEREHEHLHRPHLFGADEASRSPAHHPDQGQAASGEREDQPSMRQPIFDPIQMMVDLMHQAINSQLAPTDLTNNKDDTNNKPSDNLPAEPSEERPQLPPGIMVKPTNIIRPTQNETREDVVEIEGKKYLRKVVINRHVGENLIFMTKRLIFVPINETDSTTETVATTSTTTSAVDATTVAPSTPKVVDRVGENKPLTTTTKPAVEEATTAASSTIAPAEQTTPSPSSSPSTQAPSVEQSAATTPANSESSFVERVSDAIERAAERLVKDSQPSSTTSTTTEKPQAA